MDNAFELIADMAKQLSSKYRIAIIHAIGKDSITAAELANRLPGVSKNAIYNELHNLRKDGVLIRDDSKKVMYYKLAKPNQWLDFLNNVGILELELAG